MTFAQESPELQEIALELPDSGLRIDTWTHYTYNSDFLTPTDGWDFALGGYQYTPEVKAALIPGARVTLSIDGHVQASGIIDDLTHTYDRSGGTEIYVCGRDMLAAAVDAGANPGNRVARDTTLDQFLQTTLEPYGFDVFLTDNADNRTVVTGNIKGTRTSKKGKPLKSFTLHQLKPNVGESVFGFASRVTQRQGLWIWATADGSALVVGTPTFDQPESGVLRRTLESSNENNILHGTVRQAITEQVDVLIAEGFGYGGEWGHALNRAYIVNPMTARTADGFDPDDIAAIVAQYPDATRVTPPPVPKRLISRETMRVPPKPRIKYMRDTEAHTSEQLQRFVRREMALRMGRGVEVHYTVEGHSQNGTPWCVDTIVHVVDEVAGLDEPMWVQSRTFHKSRTGGTTTTLKLIRPYTLEF